ncbi:MAG: c-type cytochrome [Gammaproteobacteria bacterium]|nr:c-type cytochrome [Gammaproteobacteria bacterium]
MYKSTHAVILTFVLTVAASAAAAESGDFERKLAACGACHGEKGDKPLAPDYPILAGQKADYLSAALRHYRDGRRNNPIMGAQVQALQLTEDDIVRLGEYFAQQTGPLATLKN